MTVPHGMHTERKASDRCWRRDPSHRLPHPRWSQDSGGPANTPRQSFRLLIAVAASDRPRTYDSQDFSVFWKKWPSVDGSTRTKAHIKVSGTPNPCFFPKASTSFESGTRPVGRTTSRSCFADILCKRTHAEIVEPSRMLSLFSTPWDHFQNALKISISVARRESGLRNSITRSWNNHTGTRHFSDGH